MHWAPKFGGWSWGTTLGPPTLLAPCRARGTQVTLTLCGSRFQPRLSYVHPPTDATTGRCQVAQSGWAPRGTRSSRIQRMRDPNGGGKAGEAQVRSRVPRPATWDRRTLSSVPNREVTVRLKLCKCGRPPGGAPPALLASSLPRPAGAVQFLPFPLASQQIPLLLTFARGGFGGLHLASKPRHPQNP